MIELKQVSFTYQGQEHDGLRDIDLTIADGECVLFCVRRTATMRPETVWGQST